MMKKITVKEFKKAMAGKTWRHMDKDTPGIVGIMDGDKIHMSYMLENTDQILVDTDTGSNRIAMTNENGREIIVTKDGWITPLEASDMVIPNDITETLIDMAERQQNYAMNGNFKMPELKVKDASGNSVNNVYNTFTVQGDLTRDTLPELNKILDLASSKTQNDIRKNKRRFG